MRLISAKVGVDQGAGHLSGPVGAEVQEDDAVAFFDAAALGADHGLEEFVGDPGVVRGLDGLAGVLSEGGAAARQGVIGPLEALPTAVPIHGIVAAGKIGDLAHAQLPHFILELLHDSPGRRWGRRPGRLRRRGRTPEALPGAWPALGARTNGRCGCGRRRRTAGP